MTHKEFLQKVRFRNEQKLEAGLVSEHFPEVSGIVIKMTYFRKPANSVYIKRTVNMSPSSYADFNMSCMIRRGYDRGLDLTPVITDQVRRHEKIVKGEFVFNGQKDNSDSYFKSVIYKINVQYKN